MGLMPILQEKDEDENPRGYRINELPAVLSEV